MIDWNRNGKIDPEDVVLTEILRRQEEDAEEEETRGPGKASVLPGCLLNLLILPVLMLFGGWKR